MGSFAFPNGECSLTLQVNQNKKRFNRSLTEVRPDAYIFDDGLHFEVRTVQEEDEMIHSHETLNEQRQQMANVRKQSVLSEDSDLFVAEKVYVPPSTGNETKPPYLTLQARNETTSTESKDTLTPIEPSIQPIAEDEDGSTENIMELNFEVARQKALRRRAMGRRNSECCSNYDLNRSQTSLNATLAMSRRQLSLTHSEPDSGNELTGNSLFFIFGWFFFLFLMSRSWIMLLLLGLISFECCRNRRLFIGLYVYYYIFIFISI